MFEKGTRGRRAILEILQGAHAGREPFMRLTAAEVGRILDARRKRAGRKRAGRTRGR